MSDLATSSEKTRSPLDAPARERVIGDLHAARLLSADAQQAAFAELQGERHWWRWANRMLLFVGSALLLAGIVFFFAYNWARMNSVAKFGVIESGLWLCALGAMRAGLEKLTGKVLLLSACVFVGVLLAVYGQVYQTGADAWQNYAMWALLILPWVAISKFAALWIVWLVVANVAAILFWIQVDAPRDFEFVLGIFLILAGFNGVALAARERGASAGWTWLQHHWTRQLIWLSIVAYLTIPTVLLIVDFDIGNGAAAGAAVWTLTIAGGQFYFRRVRSDLPSVSINVLSVCLVLLTLIGKVIFEVSEGAAAFLLFGMIALGVSSAAAFYLRNAARSGGDEENDEST